MSKKTVFSNPTGKESHSRNAFDRSVIKHVNFSAGMLIPTFCQFYFGNSHARLNQRAFIRTADVNTAAFPSLPMYTDYFYVPMHQILSNWNAFKSRTNDRFSARLGNISRLPSFSKSDLVTSLIIMSGATDDVGFRQDFGAIRLLDLLGYGNTKKEAYAAANFAELNATGDQTPLKLCAYQKIYYDHYRNTAYEPNRVSTYNLDDLYTLSGDNETLNPAAFDQYRLASMLQLHYVNYRRDFYNTIYPSLNFVSSAANALQLNNSLPASIVNTYINGANVEQGAPLRPFSGLSVDVNGGDSTYPFYGKPFSLQNLRVAFALEKLLRLSAFTPQHVKDQFKARFGYVPKSDGLHESVRLGSFRNDIVIGEVTSTAMIDPAVYNQRLGTIGGKGVGASDFQHTISYDVPEDGFIMGVSYILPYNSYDSSRVDPINQQFVPEDWSLPEYENLGLQPVYGKNLYLVRDPNGDTDAAQITRSNVVLGYQPRDMQFKVGVSENHGVFHVNEPLSTFTLHGKLSELTNIGLSPTPAITYQYFKASPTDLNTLFVSGASGHEDDDQFFGEINIQSAVIQDKPILGIPKL